MVVRVLGDDGGAICQDPNAALSRAALLDRLMNGAAGPGMRPVIADNRAVKGELLVIQIYCPDSCRPSRSSSTTSISTTW